MHTENLKFLYIYMTSHFVRTKVYSIKVCSNSRQAQQKWYSPNRLYFFWSKIIPRVTVQLNVTDKKILLKKCVNFYQVKVKSRYTTLFDINNFLLNPKHSSSQIFVRGERGLVPFNIIKFFLKRGFYP